MLRRLGFGGPLALGVLGAPDASAAEGFVPFADVEELRPHRISDFCAPEVLEVKEGHGRIRRCSRHVKKRLDDGGDLELSWSMDVDPDRILSLDTEAEHGVRLTRCSAGELELELPHTHRRHAEEGQLVVGSRFVHGCPHLGDRHLFHRVKAVHPQQTEGQAASRMSRFRLVTEELASLAHAVPSLRFHFSWMPVEATDEAEWPEMRTDFGLNRRELERRRRRLSVFESFTDNLKDHVTEDPAGFKGRGKLGGDMDTDEGYVNLMPKQLSNFGWNWNFDMNATEEPDFELDVPGAQGILKLRKPCIKVHAGLYLNFSSQFIGITLPPRVEWTWGLKGKGRVQARMLGSLNTTSDAGTDPFMAFKLPIFQEIEHPRWFEKVEFATGSLPITMEPGFKCTATMYHRGSFKGAVAIGGRTHGVLNPSLSYDSIRGFETKFFGNLTDTNIWPPLWLIFTKSFEMGVVLKPSLLMRGDFSGLERATMAIESRPFLNVTVTRQSSNTASASEGTDAMKPLTVYPMRVTGLNTLDFSKKYKVKISVNGEDVETSAQVNFGQVEFRDHISNFECGQMPRQALLTAKIKLSLIEVTDDVSSQGPAARTLATGEVSCDTLGGDECSPTPSNVELTNAAGVPLATAQVAILWTSDPNPWFASKIRGLGLTFPQVIVRQDTLKPAYVGHVGGLVPGQQAQNISMHVIHGGQTYVVPLVGSIASDQTALAGSSSLEFGPAFVDTWAPCPVGALNCGAPRLELWAESTLIGTAPMPAIDTAPQGGFMKKGAPELNVPSTVSLMAPGGTSATVALTTMTTKVLMMLGSSMFVQPRAETLVALDSSQKLIWTVSDVDRSKQYAFTVQPLIVKDVPAHELHEYANYRKVNGKVLVPVAVKGTVSGVCDTMTASGLPVDQAPCTFSTDFWLRDSSYRNGMIVVVEVSWSAAGSDHKLFSPPMLLGSGGGGPKLGRRLGAVAHAEPRMLFSREAWNARMQQHAKSCNKRDLRFNLGMGLKMRGKIEGITVPQGFPMVADEEDSPALTTGFRTIFEEEPGESAMEAMGGVDSPLCKAGLCQGALPGCSGGGPEKMHFPHLVFDFNRPFFFGSQSKGTFNGMMKQALAYAFSTMPEMVDVAIQEANKTDFHKLGKRLVPSPAPPPKRPQSNWWDEGQGGGASQSSPAVDWPTQPLVPAPTPAPKPQDSITDAFNKWWSGAEGGRRLTPAAGRLVTDAGDADELPQELAGHQVRLRFSRGVPFVIDRPLVQLMLENGYFADLEDVDDGAVKTHGPLEITRFYVDSGLEGTSARDGPRQAARLEAAATSSGPWLLLAMVAAVCLTALAAVSRRGAGRRPCAEGCQPREQLLLLGGGEPCDAAGGLE